MKVSREDLNRATVKLTVECSADQVSQGFNKAVKKLGKNVKVPGFRPGTAPKKLVEDALVPEALYQTAAEEIIRGAFDQALESEKIEPHAQPKFDISKFDREKGEFEFSAKVPLKPVVDLGEYKGLKGERVKVEVTDEEIDRQIDDLRRQGSEKKEVTDRGVQEGDVAVVNIKLATEEGPGRTFMIVAGQTFAGLDKAIAGLSPEDSKTVTLDFPQSFQHEAWAGSKKKATVTVVSISAVQMPELDDDFAKNFQVENVEGLKDKVREAIQNAKERSSEEMLRDSLMNDLLSKSDVEVAENTWEQVMDSRMQQIEEQAKEQKKTAEQLIEESGTTMDDFMKNLEAEAQENVRKAVVINKIFEDNKMEVTNEDLGLHLTEIAMENRIPREQFEEFVKQYGAQLREEVVFRTMNQKVMEMLVEHAQITEVGEPGAADDKPKKAKRTKKVDKE